MALTPIEQAAHLRRRAGFGASAREIHETAELGIERALDELLDFEREDADLERALETFAGDAFDLNNSIDDVRAWWLYRMIHTRRPLREKLTLFWHGHFATSAQKVDRTASMIEQNRMLRRLCGANFREFLEAVAKDPAMLVYLDSNSNKKGKPNENFARELMELFSLGIGNYTEKDVQEAARAFTGWHIADGAYKFNAGQHDGGEKTVLGRKGKLNGGDVLDLVATHPATPTFLARKLCRFFVNDQPDAAYVERVASAYRRSGGSLRAMVEALFRDPAFFAEENVRSVVKSPVEFAVGALKTLGVTVPLRNLAPSLRKMGQNLLAPPSVKGWDGGDAWLTSTSLFERGNFAAVVTYTRGLSEEPRFDPREWLAGRTIDSIDSLVDALAAEILQGPLTEPTRTALLEYLRPGEKEKWSMEPKTLDPKLRGAARLLISSPEFQLA